MSGTADLTTGEILDVKDGQWMSLVGRDPRSCIFHHPSWIHLLTEAYGYRSFVLVRRDAGGVVCAGLPIVEIKNPFSAARWVSLPFSDHCTPLYQDGAQLSALVGDLVELYSERKPARVEARAGYPEHALFQQRARHVLHLLPLSPDPEVVFQRLHAMHRRNVRLALRKGVHVERGVGTGELKAFYRLHTLTRRRQGLPVQPWSFFEALGNSLLEKGLGFVLLALADRACLAAAIFLTWGGTITYKYGASTAEWLRLRPNDLLFWTAIRWGCENGYAAMDLGRTDLENVGLREFKTRWGAVETPLVYAFLPAAPASERGRGSRAFLRAAIRRSPLWVCRGAGELFYRYFG